MFHASTIAPFCKDYKMSMSFGGDPYAALVQALMQRRQQQAQRQPAQQQQMPQMGGTMQMQPARFDGGSGGGQSAMTGALGNMPSASSMADMLKNMQGGGGSGPSMWERFQGWGSDLGSRLPTQPGGQIQTYQPGQTPIGGGY